MKIIKLKKLSKGRYKVTFDNNDNLNLYEEAIVNNSILYGKEITEEAYQKILSENHKVTPYHQALQYIETRRRSKEEIRSYLEKKGTEEELIEGAITKLEQNGYIDDKAFAHAYISDKLHLSNDGLMKIKKSLGNYKIDENLIDELLSQVDSNDLIDRIDSLIDKQIRVNKKYSGDVLKHRIYNYLINLGYDGNAVIDRLDNYNLKDKGNVSKEYQKLYKKYSSKHNGYKLEMKIKEQLYKKGYSLSDIDDITK